MWFPHRQQVGTSGIEPLSRQTRWIFSRCLSIRLCVHVHRIPRQKYPMPLQFFFKCNFAAKSTHADCCVKSPPGLEPGTYSKKGLKEKLLFQLSYDDIFVAVSVKSGYDNVIFRQPPPGSWQCGIRTHEPIGTDLQSACFDHLHTCQELPDRWQLPGVLPPITVSLPKKTGLNFTSADKLNIKRSTYCSMPNCNGDGRYRTCDTLDISQLLYHWATSLNRLQDG